MLQAHELPFRSLLPKRRQQQLLPFLSHRLSCRTLPYPRHRALQIRPRAGPLKALRGTSPLSAGASSFRSPRPRSACRFRGNDPEKNKSGTIAWSQASTVNNLRSGQGRGMMNGLIDGIICLLRSVPLTFVCFLGAFPAATCCVCVYCKSDVLFP